MRWRLGLPLLLVGAAVMLVPLAHVFPLDPAWISGIYDDGDCDAAITLAGSLVAVADFSLPGPGADILVALWRVHLASIPCPGLEFRSTCQNRAPPRLMRFS